MEKSRTKTFQIDSLKNGQIGKIDQFSEVGQPDKIGPVG